MAAKNKFLNAMKMPSIDDMFSSEADRQRESGDLVTYADEGWYVEKTTFASDTAAYNGNYHIHKDSGLTESQDQVAKGKAFVIRNAPIWTVPYGTAHNLQACRTYKSVWLEYASSPLAQKDTFYKQNGAALQTYYRAASQLDKMGISLGTEPEKVRQLVTVASIKVLFRGIKASIHTRFALSHAHDLGILHYREHYPT